MRFNTFLRLLSLDLMKIGWNITSYSHRIEEGKYNISFQKIVSKFQHDEPVQKVIMHEITFDELCLSRMSAKELIRNCILELGAEDIKA